MEIVFKYLFNWFMIKIVIFGFWRDIMRECIREYEYEGKVYPLNLRWDKFRYDDLTVEIEKVRGWCKDGCPDYNKNGACPPYSPTVDKLLKDKDFLLLICKVPTSFSDIEDHVEKGTFLSDVAWSFSDKLGYKLMDSYGTDFLTPGQCQGCEICTIESGCKKPERRVYSITGTGIMLGDVMENLFHEKLQWFTKDFEPEYVTKIMTIISEDKTDFIYDNLESLL